MRRYELGILRGEDVGAAGSVFKILLGLHEEFGPDRVIDTPIAEAGYVGLGVGAALTGMRPIVDIMFGDFMALAMDQIGNQAAKLRYMSGGQATVPLTIRATMGAGRSSAAQHSQSLHAWASHIHGLKVVVPSTPADVLGLFPTAVRDDNPVLFFEDKMMYAVKGTAPETVDPIPFGVADVKREGSDVTLIATSSMVLVAVAAAETLADDGISCEIVDPRTMVPLDTDTLVQSASKTGHAVIIDEGCRSFGVGAEVAARIANDLFSWLDGPVRRIAGMDTWVSYAPNLEDVILPQTADVLAGIVDLAKF